MHLFSSGGLLDNVSDGRFFRQLRSAKSAFLCGRAPRRMAPGVHSRTQRYHWYRCAWEAVEKPMNDLSGHELRRRVKGGRKRVSSESWTVMSTSEEGKSDRHHVINIQH
jgi:hypothetical protein